MKRGYMTKNEKLKYCIGCEQDFYNGKNSIGVKECWHLEKMELILRKRVYINEVPPWKRKPEKLANCYQEKGYIFIRPDLER
jgi:hypothetical protein